MTREYCSGMLKPVTPLRPGLTTVGGDATPGTAGCDVNFGGDVDWETPGVAELSQLYVFTITFVTSHLFISQSGSLTDSLRFSCQLSNIIAP